jgi:quercetin dioxygenase-like cupin family protein
MAEVKIIRLEDAGTIERFKGVKGVHSRALPTGERMSVVVNEFEPGVKVGHSHDEEEIAYLVSGRMEFTAGGQKAVVETGQFMFVPSGVEHGGAPLVVRKQSL